MNLAKTNISCGIYQLNGVTDVGNTPEGIVDFVTTMLRSKKICKEHGYANAHARPPIILFSDLVDPDWVSSSIGQKLAKHIEEKRLGTVNVQKFINNRNRNFACEFYTWFLDYKALGLEELLKPENYR